MCHITIMIFSCCKKKTEEVVYEQDDARYWMRQLDEGLELSISPFEVCKLLLDFPISNRRTRTSPVRLQPENVPLHDRLIRLLTNIAQDAVLESERMAYSFWNSFSACLATAAHSNCDNFAKDWPLIFPCKLMNLFLTYLQLILQAPLFLWRYKYWRIP